MTGNNDGIKTSSIKITTDINKSIRAKDLNDIATKLNEIISAFNSLTDQYFNLSYDNLIDLPTISGYPIKGEISVLLDLLRNTEINGGGEINISPVLTSINTFTTIEINKTIATVNVITDNDSVNIGTLNVSCTNLPDGLTCKLNDSNEIIIARNSYYSYY